MMLRKEITEDDDNKMMTMLMNTILYIHFDPTTRIVSRVKASQTTLKRERRKTDLGRIVLLWPDPFFGYFFF